MVKSAQFNSAHSTSYIVFNYTRCVLKALFAPNTKASKQVREIMDSFIEAGNASLKGWVQFLLAGDLSLAVSGDI
jgi:hypothetical protein